MNNENMVLRTVYLPPELDERLREIAFHNRISKNEVMRCAIDAFVEEKPSEQGEKIKRYKAKQSKTSEALMSTSR